MNSTMHWLTTAFDGAVGFFPSLIAGLLILFVGYVVGKILAGVPQPPRPHPLRPAARQDRVIDSPESHVGSQWTGTAVFVVVMLAAIMQAARAWNLTMVALGVSQIIGYIPHLIGAAVIFGAALYFGDWVRNRIAQGENVRFGQRSLVASSVRAGILALGAFMALRELQIAPEIVDHRLHPDPVGDRACGGAGLRPREPRRGRAGDAAVVRPSRRERKRRDHPGAPPTAVSTQTWPGPGPRP